MNLRLKQAQNVGRIGNNILTENNEKYQTAEVGKVIV